LIKYFSYCKIIIYKHNLFVLLVSNKGKLIHANTIGKVKGFLGKGSRLNINKDVIARLINLNWFKNIQDRPLNIVLQIIGRIKIELIIVVLNIFKKLNVSIIGLAFTPITAYNGTRFKTK